MTPQTSRTVHLDPPQTIMLENDIKELVAAGAAADRDKARAVFAQLREALSAGQVRAAEPDASSPLGWRVNTWVKQGILLGFRFGDMVDASMDHGKLPFYDKDTLPLQEAGARRRRPHRAGRIGDPRRRLSRARRHLHAADVREHRRLRRRGLDDRLARARRLVRAGRRARARQRRGADRRRHRTGRARCRSSSKTKC